MAELIARAGAEVAARADGVAHEQALSDLVGGRMPSLDVALARARSMAAAHGGFARLEALVTTPAPAADLAVDAALAGLKALVAPAVPAPRDVATPAPTRAVQAAPARHAAAPAVPVPVHDLASPPAAAPAPAPLAPAPAPLALDPAPAPAPLALDPAPAPAPLALDSPPAAAAPARSPQALPEDETMVAPAAAPPVLAAAAAGPTRSPQALPEDETMVAPAATIAPPPVPAVLQPDPAAIASAAALAGIDADLLTGDAALDADLLSGEISVDTDVLTGDEELDALLRGDEPVERESRTEVAVDVQALVQDHAAMEPASEAAGDDAFDAGADTAATTQGTSTLVVALAEQVVAELAPDADELEAAAPPAAAAPTPPAAGPGFWTDGDLDDVDDLSFSGSFSIGNSGRASAAVEVTAVAPAEAELFASEPTELSPEENRSEIKTVRPAPRGSADAPLPPLPIDGDAIPLTAGEERAAAMPLPAADASLRSGRHMSGFDDFADEPHASLVTRPGSLGGTTGDFEAASMPTQVPLDAGASGAMAESELEELDLDEALEIDDIELVESEPHPAEPAQERLAAGTPPPPTPGYPASTGYPMRPVYPGSGPVASSSGRTSLPGMPPPAPPGAPPPPPPSIGQGAKPPPGHPPYPAMPQAPYVPASAPPLPGTSPAGYPPPPSASSSYPNNPSAAPPPFAQEPVYPAAAAETPEGDDDDKKRGFFGRIFKK